MNQLQTFAFSGHGIRTVTDPDGQPWFVAADVCAVLDIGNTSMALGRLDEDEKGVSSIDTRGGTQRLATVNESGLYSLVLGSRKPEAKAFKRWVTPEVLPSIRRTGQYGQPVLNLRDPKQLAQAALQLIEVNQELQARVDAMQTTVAAHERIAVADGSLCITDAAKALQVRQKDLFAWLQANQWIYRRPGNAAWLGYQTRVQQGVVEHKVSTFDSGDGTEKVVEQVRVTPKGRTVLAQKVPGAQIQGAAA